MNSISTNPKEETNHQIPRMSPFLPLSVQALILLISHSFTASAASFTCNTTPSPRCQSLIDFAPTNATNLAAIQSLFGLPSLSSLLGLNPLPVSTPPSYVVPALQHIRIPIPCNCSKGTGTSNHVPVYTVVAGDGLDAIARNKFGGFVTYQEIAAANGLPNPDKIEVGKRLWIPLPCSCDPVGGHEAVHLAHVVDPGSSVAAIAEEFGVDAKTLMAINGLADPKQLKAGQVLDVPLRACSSSISKESLDYGLSLPNGSYALTANNCISCSCNTSYQLDCHTTKGLSSLTCPTAMCGSVSLGHTTISSCEVTTCAYTGYTNSTKLQIFANFNTESLCNSGGPPAPQPNGPPGSNPNNHAPHLGLNSPMALILLHLVIACLVSFQ